MAHMNLAASSIATRRARGRTVTVTVEAMSFLSPVMVGDEVSFYGRVVSTGRTSIRIHMEAWRRRREDDDMIKVTEAASVFVALGEDRAPRPLP